MREKKEKTEKEGRVKVANLPRVEKDLDRRQSANIKGGGGRGGIGGEVRSITDGNPQQTTA